jgi:hypothetical protein
MTSFLMVGALVASLGSPTAPTLGAYCGPARDTAAIQTAFIAEHAKNKYPVTRSAIMAIAAYFPGGVGQVTYTGSGQAEEYFAQTSGGWRSVGFTAPSYFPKAALAFFNRMGNLRANGGKQCVNPAFVPKGSG